MKPCILKALDKLLLRKRSIIETINDQLKNISQIEHSHHRSLTHCMINVVGGLVAYSYFTTVHFFLAYRNPHKC